ncbi:hypothetical protein [Nocardioides sp. GXZ039]|uniref:hypothetical protein n=1 Tax=Nocardioides sp. GXZ039 TaxID=3136018 RepID=UPI0030F3CE29
MSTVVLRSGNRAAELRWKDLSPTVVLAPGYYRRAHHEQLAGQLADLAAQHGSFEARRSASDLSRQYDVLVQPDHLAVGARDVELRTRVAELYSWASDDEGLVMIETWGQVQWRVTVSPVVPTQIEEERFVAAAEQALAGVWHVHRDGAQLLAAQMRTGASDADLQRARELIALAGSR